MLTEMQTNPKELVLLFGVFQEQLDLIHKVGFRKLDLGKAGLTDKRERFKVNSKKKKKKDAHWIAI